MSIISAIYVKKLRQGFCLVQGSMRSFLLKRLWIFTLITITLFSSNSWARFDQAIEWNEMAALDFATILRSQYASRNNLYDPTISNSVIDLVLKDGDHRIQKDFQIPELLRPNVAFWLRIYTQYSTENAVIFDSNHMEIYDVVDLKQAAANAKNQDAYDKARAKLVQSALGRYRKAFASLAKSPRPKHPTLEEKNILAVTSKMKHKHSFRELSENLKAVRGQRDTMIKGLIAAETFLPKMELIFSRMDIPVELTRLALIESSFNPRALSKVGALGVWQFMPYSGKNYLTMDSHRKIDERLSPLKSTLAAGKLLLWNYRYLGNWALAITSYNHGPRHLPRYPGKSFNKIAHLFQACKPNPVLGFASRNYYSELLAGLYAETYRDLFYGATPTPSIRPVMFKRLAKSQTGLAVALEAGISLQEFRLFNGDVQDLHIPLPKGFWIAVPGENDDIAALVENVLSRS